MPDIRRFDTRSLFAIKVESQAVRTGTRVAVLGAFDPNGRVRPGFRVNFMSTEGVGGTAQVIRFDSTAKAQRWIEQVGGNYYAPDDLELMTNRAGEYVRLPLADFNEDIWVNSIIIGRLKDRTKNLINQHCPEYLDERTFQQRELAHVETPQYRGFRF